MTSSFQPKSPAFWSDFLLWGTLLGLVVWAGTWTYHRWNTEHRETLVLDFKDANEMTVGANVRLMGTDIGYVDGIQLKGDRVDVKIKTDRHTVPIPSGARATILFTGLGGAKSIEIDPPQTTDPFNTNNLPGRVHVSTKGIIVEEPIRQKDNMQYMIDIAESLRDGANNFSRIFGNTDQTEELSANIRQTSIHSQKLAMGAAQTAHELSESMATYERIKPQFFEIASEMETSLAKTAEWMDNGVIGHTAYDVIHTISVLFDRFSDDMSDFQRKGGFERLQNRTQAFHQVVTTIQDTKPPIPQTLSHHAAQTKHTLRDVDTQMNRVMQTHPEDWPKVSQRILWLLNSVNQQLQSWTAPNTTTSKTR